MDDQKIGPDAASDRAQKDKAAARPVLQMLARLMATDRRGVVLASRRGEILLANAPARRLGLEGPALSERLDWPDLCDRARRVGSILVQWDHSGQSYQGEVVELPLGPASGFLLRLSESDQEAALLRNRMRSAMLMRVAHDLRTPIQSLLASAEMLLDDSVADKAVAGARLRQSAELALDHISNVLAVIRGEQGVAGSQPDEDFRLVPELRNLIEMVRPIAATRGAGIDLNIDVPEDLALHGPVRFVRALFQNMLDNAVKHGGARVQIRVQANPLQRTALDEEDGGDPWRVRIEIADEGGGLPPAQRARLNEALGLPGGGAGAVAEGGRPSAGLNVLAHALRQLGGEIAIADRGSDGAAVAGGQGPVLGTILTATFSLPRAIGLPMRVPAAPAGANALTGRGILLVEDSPASRDWLTQLLESFGAQVWAAGSGPEALALLAQPDIAGRVELVLTDVTLPRITGIQLARMLGSDEVDWQGRVVGLTAHVDPQIRAACLAAGMMRVLEKPIRPQQLCAALTGVLVDHPPGGGAIEAVDCATRLEGQTVLETEIVRDLIDRLGAAPARKFMGRALAEARAVAEDLRRDGIVADSQRQLHAATGACGLTGLVLVERRLRRIELAVAENQTDLGDLLSALEQALDQTRRLTEEMA